MIVRLSTILGALLGFGFVIYHNAHVSLLTGGYVYNGRGYVACMGIGAGLGFIVGRWIQRGSQ